MLEKIKMLSEWDIHTLVEELERGDLRIPRFQRGYVWEPSRVVKLLNSIYNEYPIGSFFVWETDQDMVCFSRAIPELRLPDKPNGNRFAFILDGQQRSTSLYAVLKGLTVNNRDYSKICFNVNRKAFHIPTLRKDEDDISVCDVYDVSSSQNLIAKYAAAGKIDAVNAIMGCNLVLRKYPLSVVKYTGDALRDVVEIFERINQGGKRLTLFDLVHASAWAPDFDLRDKIADFNDEINVRQFGFLPPEVFTQALSLNLSNSCTNACQLEMTAETCRNAWDRTAECLRLAIDFVKGLGALQASFVPYPSMMAVIQYYFYAAGVNVMPAREKGLMTDWFWTVAFSQRYSSSTLTRMDEDVRWVRTSLIAGTFDPRIFGVALNADDLFKVRMNQRSVIKNAILCILAANGPVDFDNGDRVPVDKTNVSQTRSRENHHVFPFSLREKFGLSDGEANSVLNFAFITKRLNGQISNKKPSAYFAEYAANENLNEFLKTHFIDALALAAARDDNYEAFAKARASWLFSEIKRLCRIGEATVTGVIDETYDEDDVEGAVD